MAKKIITSTKNPRIKNILKLKSSRKERETQGLIIIEGRREISLALEAKVDLDSLFYCPKFLKDRPLFKIASDDLYEISPEVFEKISFRENPDGLLALSALSERTLDDLKLSANPLIIVIEAVEKPGNLGAIIRTADAAGADAVLVSDPKTDIYNPNVVRASQGTVFTKPVVASTLNEIHEYLKTRDIALVATTPAAKKAYTDIDFKKPTAILMGTEDTGLSKQWLEKADEKVRLPMKGKIDSLNVSVATAIVVYEALRQRGK